MSKPPSRTMYKARFVSRHFDFEAYGDTKTGALAALRLGLKHHANQYEIPDKNWFKDYTDDFAVTEITLGAAYRDGDKIK